MLEEFKLAETGDAGVKLLPEVDLVKDIDEEDKDALAVEDDTAESLEEPDPDRLPEEVEAEEVLGEDKALLLGLDEAEVEDEGLAAELEETEREELAKVLPEMVPPADEDVAETGELVERTEGEALTVGETDSEALTWDSNRDEKALLLADGDTLNESDEPMVTVLLAVHEYVTTKEEVGEGDEADGTEYAPDEVIRAAEVAVTEVLMRLVKVLVKVSGQMVVETARVEVTMLTLCLVRGQLVTSAGQLRTVTSLVAKTVEVETAGTYWMNTAVVT